MLALPTFVVAIDLFVLLLALPGPSAELGADGLGQLWVTDVYGFLLAGFTLAMGTLGDRIGRRGLLMIGAVTFAAASLLCAYATSVVMLIAARALLGIAVLPLVYAGAGATAGTLNAAQAEALLAAAREAFTGGVHAVATVGAVLFLAVALLVARALRHVPPFTPPD